MNTRVHPRNDNAEGELMNILVINGPNLNMLGIREPDIYGRTTYAVLCALIEDHAEKIGVDVELYQSNHEGDLVDHIQKAYNRIDGIVINPGAYTHTSRSRRCRSPRWRCMFPRWISARNSVRSAMCGSRVLRRSRVTA